MIKHNFSLTHADLGWVEWEEETLMLCTNRNLPAIKNWIFLLSLSIRSHPIPVTCVFINLIYSRFSEILGFLTRSLNKRRKIERINDTDIYKHIILTAVVAIICWSDCLGRETNDYLLFSLLLPRSKASLSASHHSPACKHTTNEMC